jgi:uncharacterized damage-inducible protein DinB
MSYQVVDSLIAAYATNQRINLYLIENLPDAAWRDKLPGKKGRDIASIVGHMHSVRLMWLKACGKASAMPVKLEGEFSKAEAIAALNESWRAMEPVLRDAFGSDGRVKGFKPDVGSFLAYLLAHDAHHRGQIAMLARQLGHPLSQSAMFGMWEWGTR